MPIQTDISVSPYFDDFDENRDYYKILFRPGVSVQARELNQLQTLLQKQVERFGDNIFKRGTIIDGCDISYHSTFPFVKIKDNEVDGTPVNVLSYVGYNLKNSANIAPLIAAVTTVVSGYESQSPDLNTLYIRYINSGFANVGGVSTEVVSFAANDVLTVYDPKNVIEKVVSYNDSSGFSNTDSVVFCSALAIQNSTGGTYFANAFNVGDYITDTTANAQIVAIDSTSNSEVVILQIKPRAADLKVSNNQLWTFTTNTNIQTTNASPSSVANVVAVIGSGAQGTLLTGSLGEVDLISVTSKGSGYYVLPTVSIASIGATTGQISTANLVAQNFLTTVQIANSTVNPIGSGYAMTVGKGVIYQKGYFSRVNEHLVVVEKYANTPNEVSVGFDTAEEIVNSNQDQTLLDNATGSPNATAPGANRLKLTPKLVVKSKAEADANTDFLSIAEFSQGNPYKQNRQTVYNIIGNEMAKRTYEESGNYVLDPFILNTKSPDTFSDESSMFDISVDPGKAYISGKRIETNFSYETGVQKGTDTVVATNATISLNYGNYLRVNQLGGVFLFKTGDLIELWNTPGTYISSGAAAAPSNAGLGVKLGTARIKSVTLETGSPGSAEAVYRVYLFDIQLATARNLTLVRSIYYNGTHKGIADVIQENGATVLKDNNGSTLLYYAGNPAVKNANNISYIYRTIANNMTLTTNGVISWSVTGGETFPYTGTLSSTQENDLIIIPLANAQASANLAGSITCNTSSTQVNGTSTSFTTDLQAGDFLKLANSSANVVVQVNNVVNNTVFFAKNAPSSAISGNTVLFFPANVPVSLNRTTRTANVDITATTFYVNMGTNIQTATSVAVAYNVRSSNTTPVNKNVTRDRYVRLNLANNVASNTGPWSLGVPDVFRLKGVYLGSNNTFAPGDSGVTDVTNNFFVDHNQGEDFYGLSYLYKNPTSTAALANNAVLLVKLDNFTDAGSGLKGPGSSGSYNINDTLTLANSVSSINTLEIPEVFGVKGEYYDLRDHFDFRPQSANTVALSATAATAPINPAESDANTRFDTSDKKFPAPDSVLTGTIEYYVGRVSRVAVNSSGTISIIQGIPGTKNPPTEPSDALTINLLNIPPYPSVPYQMSAGTIAFIDTKVVNEKYSSKRLANYRVSTPIDTATRAKLQPRGYTMSDIGSLERRIAALEYYTTFTLVETLTQKRSIPSSANTAMERYKFGFYVDTFSNYSFADINNPGYKASIIDGYLSPHAEEIMLSADSDSTSTILPYNEVKFIAQTNATDGPIQTVPVPTTGANTSTGTVTVPPTPAVNNTPTYTQTMVSVIQNEKTRSYHDNGSVYEEFYYTFSASSGPVKFFINSRDNYIAAEIFQSTTQGGPWTSILTSASASAITNSDITTYGLYLNTSGSTTVEHAGSLERKSSGPVGRWLEDQFKMQWTHNPTGGVYYKIRIYKGGHHGGLFGGQGKKGTYGFKLNYPVDAIVNQVNLVTGFAPTTLYNLRYAGLITYHNWLRPIYSWGYPLGFTLPYISYVTPFITPRMHNTYVIGDQSVRFRVTGLRPNTRHFFHLNGVDISPLIKVEGGLLGQNIIANSDGVLEVTLYYGSSYVPSSPIERAAYNVILQAGARNLNVFSTDGGSGCTSELILPGYVAPTIANV